MGKPPEDEISLSTIIAAGGGRGRGVEEEGASSASGSNQGGFGLFRFRCLLVLLLGIAVFLPALFWVPPLLDYSDLDDPDLDPRFRGHEILATFKLQKPVSWLQDNVEQLEADILDEIEAPDAKVAVLSLESYRPNTNITIVVFGVDPMTKHSSLSSAAQSLVRASFESLVIRQSSLKLTASLFGEPYFFEVLRFPGGITVTPPQIAFLLQKAPVSFNFSLNSSIYQIQGNFEELKSQLRNGLSLASNENLYITLTNAKGATVAPPTTIQSSVLMAVGLPPSNRRLRQIVQTIKDSHGRNLGLNHTVFGKVKQVSLSSTLRNLIDGGDNGGTSEAPAPATMLPSHLHHHHHHHHHHNHHPHRHNHPHHHDHDIDLAPARVPSPLHPDRPEPVKNSLPPKKAGTQPSESHHAKPPSYSFGLKRHHNAKTTKGSSTAPAVAPKISPRHSASPLSSQQAKSPAPVSHPVPVSSPLPHDTLAHAYPRPGRQKYFALPGRNDITAPSPATSVASRMRLIPWLLSLFTAFLLHP